MGGKEALNRDYDQGTTESSTGKQTRQKGQKQLPDELLIDIISRLSTEGLGRCNCVSKLWNYALTIQAFMLHHARASVPSDTSNVAGRITTLFRSWPYYMERKPIKLLSFEIPTEVDTSFMIIDGRLKNIPKLETHFQRLSYIYDGLACLWKCETVAGPRSEFCIDLYSLKTNDFISLPMTTNYDFKNPLIKEVQTSCSVGFDTLTKEYIIFRKTSIELNDNICGMSYETLTLGSPSWNQINDTEVPLSLSQGCGSFDVREICLDGVIYWIHKVTQGYLYCGLV